MKGAEGMELTQLKYFLAVAERLHVTRAAEALHIAQPALSQSIRRLERELGVPLFEPQGRGIRLTAYGELLKGKLHPLLAQLDGIPAELACLRGEEEKTVRVNVLAASALVTSAIIEHKQGNAGVHFRLSQDREAEDWDIEVRTHGVCPPLSPKAREHCTLTEPIRIAVPSSSRFAKERAVELMQLSGEEFICLAGSKQFRSLCDGYCTQAGFTPSVLFESDNPAAVKNLIAAGLGVGFWPGFSWGKLEAPGVRLLPIRSPDCTRTLTLSLSRAAPAEGKAERFYTFLVGYFRQEADKMM